MADLLVKIKNGQDLHSDKLTYGNIFEKSLDTFDDFVQNEIEINSYRSLK